MSKYGLSTGLVVAAVVFAWSLGCQTEKQHATPGALPTGSKPDATPRLNASTYFAHAHLLEQQRDFEQAAQQYRKALELSPGFVSALNRLGITLNKLGRHAEASSQFRVALQRCPNEAYLHNNLGFSLYLEGRHEEALAELHRAVELKPEFKRAHMNCGVVLAQLTRYDEALSEFTLATEPADAHYNLGLIQAEAGRFAAAARSLETALRLSPSFDAAREQLRAVARLAAESESESLSGAATPDRPPEPITADGTAAPSTVTEAIQEGPTQANAQSAAAIGDVPSGPHLAPPTDVELAADIAPALATPPALSAPVEEPLRVEAADPLHPRDSEIVGPGMSDSDIPLLTVGAALPAPESVAPRDMAVGPRWYWDLAVVRAKVDEFLGGTLRDVRSICRQICRNLEQSQPAAESIP